MVMTKTADLAIEQIDSRRADARSIIALSDDFYRDLYPPESSHLESSDALQQTHVMLVGGFVDNQLVACGAAKTMDDDGDYAEIKRVFVIEAWRGRGYSIDIMRYLEDQLLRQGVRLFRLETGVKQLAAIALYAKLGYVMRGPFGQYQLDPLSVFMEKQATAVKRR
jgi:putative acetyltransferase